MKPMIVFSPLSNSWYVTTRYRVKDGVSATTGKKMPCLVAQTKYDVTDQILAIIDSHRKRTRVPARVKGRT